jgi:AraC-like DNA-binding protein
MLKESFFYNCIKKLNHIRMFVFEYDHINYEDLMQDFASKLGVPLHNGKFIFPRNVAIGFMQQVELQGRLQAIVFDYTFTDNYRGKRKKIKQEFYTLWFNEVTVKDDILIEIDNDEYQSGSSSFSTVMLTSSLFDAFLEASPGTRFRGINILLNNEWLEDHLGVDANNGLLQKYLSFKACRITIEPIDIEYKKLIQEIITLITGEEQFKQIAIQNRVMLLIERFFMRLAVKMQDTKMSIKLSKEDINRVMEVEALLTQDIFKPPPFINELAKMLQVSETKLKNNFKTVYGIPIYQYFQKARMVAAKEVLQTHKYSIKQVAQEMGFVNLSNFSIAFKKEFGMLPSQLS